MSTRIQCTSRILPFVVLICGTATAVAAPPFFVFEDVGDAAGLFPHVGGIAGHGAAWGDVDNDGWPDLYVGAFGGKSSPPKTNQLFLNHDGKFTRDDQAALRITGRANGGVFVDLDNDGDLDLYTTNHAINSRKPNPAFTEPNHLFRNDGGGKFTDVSEQSGACPKRNAARSVAALDYDGDGRLDLLVGECFYQGGDSRSRLYRNLGGLKFENVTETAGLPKQVTGFGVAAGDVNGDGRPDVFLAGRYHGNRLFLNDGGGKFREFTGNKVFAWDNFKDGDDTTCGVCFGDVNTDGRLDIVVGSHFGSPWTVGGVRVRLYLNEGVTDGVPKFADVTEAAGLDPLHMKSPHVEIQDFDNDGRPDIYTSIVKFADGRPHPVIFKNVSRPGGSPKFDQTALAVNDFPTKADIAIRRSSTFFEKVLKEHKVIYTAPGPSCDFNRDGKLDLFLANWWTDERSLLLENKTPGGNWLDVTVRVDDGVNRNGIGSRVLIYEAGKLGKPEALIGCQEIAVGFGYASGQEAAAHFGLGDRKKCDVEVRLPHAKGVLRRVNVKAGQRIECSTSPSK